jgi:hypothetical protein
MKAMRYDPLINRLSEDLKPVRPRRVGIDLAIVATICAIELALFFVMGATRSDMPMMMKQPTFWWRLQSLGLIALISGTLAILSFSPTYSPRRGLHWLAAIVVFCLALGLCINAGMDDFLSIIRRLEWTDGVQCAGKIILLSIPPVIGLGVLMRRGAPTDTRGSALLVGLAAAAWGAFVFVFACPFNDPLYIAVWYTVGCAVVTVISRIILPRIARW